MKLSFAPMEGVTSYIYRRTHARFFDGADAYYSPFIAPDSTGRFKAGNLRDVLPENNPGLELIPQILCNHAEPFISVARELHAMGYEELNLNVGCPSGTVFAKYKGSGMLRDPESLDRCLADIFDRSPCRVSVKTRLGVESGEEFEGIMELYRRYPLSRLIIHARPRAGMYSSPVDIVSFRKAAESCSFPLWYNGDVFLPGDCDRLGLPTEGLEGIMLGRGAVANPALFRQIKGGSPLAREELRDFHNELMEAFLTAGLDERCTMARLKELWFYMENMFPDSRREMKAVYKSQNIAAYNSAAEAVFSICQFSPEAGFQGKSK